MVRRDGRVDYLSCEVSTSPLYVLKAFVSLIEKLNGRMGSEICDMVVSSDLD